MKKILINLKDWLGYSENIDYATGLEGLDVTVFPSLPYLYIYQNRGYNIGSQKISSYEDGPHTGSISAKHLKEFDVKAVILNHRECVIDDVDKLCAKIKNAQKYDIEVILCIETIKDVELKKIKTVLNKIDTQKISIAYEPTEDIDLDEIKLHLEYIKKELKNYNVSYIYGNNITSVNIEKYDNALDVAGFLISTHALNIENLKKILSSLK